MMLGEFYYLLLMIYSLILTTYGVKTADLLKNISVSGNYSNTVENTTNAPLPDDIKSTKEDLTHYGRENFKYFNEEKKLSNTSKLYNSTEAKTPVNSQLLSIEKKGGNSIVAKKGVLYDTSDIESTRSHQIPSTNNAVITNVKQGENETLKHELNTLISRNQTEKLNSKPLQVHIAEDEMKIGSRSNIVLPIIAVILSIPLIGILIVVFYKRGAEWWQHRHYRRMDFLIDGMYNN